MRNTRLPKVASKRNKLPAKVEKPFDELEFHEGEDYACILRSDDTTDAPLARLFGSDDEIDWFGKLFREAPGMADILRTLKHRLPEMDDENAPMAGSDAVQVLADIWPQISAVLAELGLT